MKRILIPLAIVGAALALVGPASASAATIGVYPAGHKFDISAETAAQIGGSLPGTCTFGKFSGQVPGAPANVAETVLYMVISTPTATCQPGVSVSFLAGAWKLAATSYYTTYLQVPANGITMRYSSLPGCKLTNTSFWNVRGIWSNGMSNPFSRSGFRLAGTLPVTWADDSGTCAMAGQTDKLVIDANNTILGQVVYDLTNPGNLIQMSVGI